MAEHGERYVVELDAHTARFSQNLGVAGREMSSFGHHVKGVLGGIAAAFAAEKLVEGLVDVTRAAAANDAAMQRLARTMKNAGLNWKEGSKQVDEYLDKLATSSGFVKNDLLEAFNKLVQRTKSVSASQRILGVSMDFARSRGMDLVTASTLVLKGYVGQYNQLRRLGVEIPVVAVASEKQAAALKKVNDRLTGLRQAHALVSASGYKFTAAQKVQYEAQIQSLDATKRQIEAHGQAATAADHAATGLGVVAAIEKISAGQTATYADTAAGKLDRMREGVEQLKVAMGNHLLPVVLTAVTGLEEWARGLQHSDRFQNDVAQGAQAISDAFHAVLGIGQALLPILSGVGSVLGTLVNAVGGIGPVLAGVAAWHAFFLVLEGMEAVLATDAAALVALTAEAIASEGVLTGVSASFGLLASMVNPVVLLGIAVSALGAGLYYLSTQESDAGKAAHDAASDLDKLAASINGVQDAKDRAAGAAIAVQEAQYGRDRAANEVTITGSRLTKDTKKGSGASRSQIVEDRLAATGATIALARAEFSLAQATKASGVAQAGVGKTERDTAALRAKSIIDIGREEKAAREAATQHHRGAKDTFDGAQAVKTYIHELEVAAARSTPATAKVLRNLEAIARMTGQIPDKKTVEVNVTGIGQATVKVKAFGSVLDHALSSIGLPTLLPHAAGGGMVSGSYTGIDNTPVMVGAGEAILNPRQISLVDSGLSVRSALTSTGASRIRPGGGYAKGGLSGAFATLGISSTSSSSGKAAGKAVWSNLPGDDRFMQQVARWDERIARDDYLGLSHDSDLRSEIGVYQHRRSALEKLRRGTGNAQNRMMIDQSLQSIYQFLSSARDQQKQARSADVQAQLTAVTLQRDQYRQASDINAAALQTFGAGGGGASGVVVNVNTLHPGDPTVHSALALAVTRGLHQQGWRPRPRLNLGA